MPHRYFNQPARWAAELDNQAVRERDGHACAICRAPCPHRVRVSRPHHDVLEVPVGDGEERQWLTVCGRCKMGL